MRASGCGLRRPSRAEGRGSQTQASRRCLGSGRFSVAGGATLVWTALRGCTFLSGPHLPYKLLYSRSRGASRRVQGTAGGVEAKAGWGAGRASEPATELACLESKLANMHPEEKYKHILSHKLATHLAGYEIYTLNQVNFDGEFCKNFWPYQSFYVNLRQLLQSMQLLKHFLNVKGRTR